MESKLDYLTSYRNFIYRLADDWLFCEVLKCQSHAMKVAALTTSRSRFFFLICFTEFRLKFRLKFAENWRVLQSRNHQQNLKSYITCTLHSAVNTFSSHMALGRALCWPRTVFDLPVRSPSSQTFKPEFASTFRAFQSFSELFRAFQSFSEL